MQATKVWRSLLPHHSIVKIESARSCDHQIENGQGLRFCGPQTRAEEGNHHDFELTKNENVLHLLEKKHSVVRS